MTFCCERARSGALGRHRRRHTQLGESASLIGRTREWVVEMGGVCCRRTCDGSVLFQIFFFSFWAFAVVCVSRAARAMDAAAFRHGRRIMLPDGCFAMHVTLLKSNGRYDAWAAASFNLRIQETYYYAKP